MEGCCKAKTTKSRLANFPLLKSTDIKQWPEGSRDGVDVSLGSD